LFVEELTKMVLESGLVQEEDGRYVGAQSRAARPPLAIPSTLHDSLMARLDRLAPVREIAQIGAVLGREFSYDLLQTVSKMDEALLQQGLRQLVEAELMYQRGLPPQATYVFKHALIQDTAYQSLLKSKRQQLHQQIAQVLAERFPEMVKTQPELLAHHYTEASLIEQALPYWQQAGERASQRSAHVEAIAHLTTGLDLLKTLPDTTERAHQELALQLALGVPLYAVKGYGAPEVEQSGIRARELCQQLGESPQLFPVLSRLWVFYHNRGELQTAYELAKQRMRLVRSTHGRDFLSSAHTSLGMTLSYLGEFTSALTHFEQALALYDPQQHLRHPLSTSDPRVLCLSSASLPLWYLGYPDQGLQKGQESLALAEGLSHPFSQAFALWHLAECHRLRREGQYAQERAEALLALSTDQGFPHWLASGTPVRGEALIQQGQVKEGIAQMQQGLAAHQVVGTELGRPSCLALLAEAYGTVGQVEEGLTLLAEALAIVERTGERFYVAELYRLKGQLTLQKAAARDWRLGMGSSSSQASSLKPQAPSGVAQEAEGYFLTAIEIACRQQAKSLELRASSSLARLWQQQGKTTEAHQLLSNIYGWFTEGFDTKDLQEAQTLLLQLGS
jgi:predicted ATPase